MSRSSRHLGFQGVANRYRSAYEPAGPESNGVEVVEPKTVEVTGDQYGAVVHALAALIENWRGSRYAAGDEVEDLLAA